MVIANLMAGSYLHGKPKEGKYNVLFAIIGTAISLFLLHFGGFFK